MERLYTGGTCSSGGSLALGTAASCHSRSLDVEWQRPEEPSVGVGLCPAPTDIPAESQFFAKCDLPPPVPSVPVPAKLVPTAAAVRGILGLPLDGQTRGGTVAGQWRFPEEPRPPVPPDTPGRESSSTITQPQASSFFSNQSGGDFQFAPDIMRMSSRPSITSSEAAAELYTACQTQSTIGLNLPSCPSEKPGVEDVTPTAREPATFDHEARWKRMKSQLAEARRQGERKRWRVSGPCLLIGMPMWLAGFILHIYEGLCHYPRFLPPSFLSVLLHIAGIHFAALGLLPSYLWTMRLVDRSIAISIIMQLVFLMMELILHLSELAEEQCQLYDGDEDVECGCWFFGAYTTVEACCAVLLGAVLVVQNFVGRHSDAARLPALWRLLSRLNYLNAFIYVRFFVFKLSYGGEICVVQVACMSSNFIVALVFAVLSGHVPWRSWLQSWLSSSSQVRSAAGIASLMGGKKPEEVLNAAHQRFRDTTLDQLHYDDMVKSIQNDISSGVDVKLYSLSRPSKLGTVDVFLSHSWHDSAPRKWFVLQAWCSRFRAAHGREPRLWIDKFCINQTDVAADLACLPVFLAGCKSLLILFGSTYLQRLWCVCEIFIFLEMGGLPSQIEIQAVAESADEAATLFNAIQSFNVENATTFKQSDADLLKAMIRASYPKGFSEFNTKLRDALLSAAETSVGDGGERHSSRSNKSSQRLTSQRLSELMFGPFEEALRSANPHRTKSAASFASGTRSPWSTA